MLFGSLDMESGRLLKSVIARMLLAAGIEDSYNVGQGALYREERTDKALLEVRHPSPR
jgi:hypothetical protein